MYWISVPAKIKDSVVVLVLARIEMILANRTDLQPNLDLTDLRFNELKSID